MFKPFVFVLIGTYTHAYITNFLENEFQIIKIHGDFYAEHCSFPLNLVLVVCVIEYGDNNEDGGW